MRSRPVASSGVKGSPEASVPRPISFVEIDFVTAPSWFLLVLAQRKARRVKEGGEQGVFPCTAGLSGCSFAPITVTIGELRQPQQPSFDISVGVGDVEVLRPLAAVAADVPHVPWMVRPNNVKRSRDQAQHPIRRIAQRGQSCQQQRHLVCLLALRDSGREERRWVEVLAETDAKRARFQHAYAEGAINLEDLKTRKAEVEAACRLARTELADAKARSERLRALETDVEAVVTLYSKMVPQSLDTITPEERNRLYRMLGVGVEVHPDGTLEVGGGIRVCNERKTS